MTCRLKNDISTVDYLPSEHDAPLRGRNRRTIIPDTMVADTNGQANLLGPADELLPDDRSPINFFDP